MRRKDREELEIRTENQRWEAEGEGEVGRERWEREGGREKGRKKMRKRERISKDTNIQKTVLLALALDISTIPETKKQK